MIINGILLVEKINTFHVQVPSPHDALPSPLRWKIAPEVPTPLLAGERQHDSERKEPCTMEEGEPHEIIA